MTPIPPPGSDRNLRKEEFSYCDRHHRRVCLPSQNMKMPVLDVDELEQIDPSAIEKYLQNSGWTQISSKPLPACSVWQYSLPDNQKALTLLPLDPEIPDFSFRVYDLIQVLAVVENRASIAIFDSLQTAGEREQESEFNGVAVP